MSDKFVPTFAAFRLYEDGTESGSSPIEAQDTDTTGRDVSSDSQVQLRVRLDETGAGTVDGETTDDWRLEYRLNGGGSWVAITGSSAAVQSDTTGSSLSDGSATTDRSTNGISAGTGSFIAGEQEHGNGGLDNHQLTGDNHTEHVWGLLLISAGLANNDALTFRVTLNGSNIAADVVPSITVSKGGTNVLLADDVQSTSNVTAPVVAQVHVLLADDVESASEVTAPVYGHALLADDIESASEVTAPVLAGEHTLLADDVESASEVTVPVLAGEHTLLADDVESASEVTAPVLAEAGGENVLLADDVQSTSEVTTPSEIVARSGVDTFILTRDGSTVIARIDTGPALVAGGEDALLADDVESASEVTTQITILARTGVGTTILTRDTCTVIAREVSRPVLVSVGVGQGGGQIRRRRRRQRGYRRCGR